jgi:hypothetical protein
MKVLNRTRTISRLALIASCAALLMGSEVRAAAKTFYKTTSGGFETSWTEADLSVKNTTTNKIVFSAKALAQKERPKKSTRTTVDRSFKLLSQVGPYLSYQDESTFDWPGMVHPGVGDVRFYHAVDLSKAESKTGPKLSLTDLYSEDAVFKALMANASIKKALKENHATPKNLPALMKSIQDTSIETMNSDGNSAKLLFNRDMLSQFCINNEKGDLSISLYDQANNEISPLKLHFAMTDLKNGALAKQIGDAASQKSGVLADKLAKQKPDAETDFHFDP